MLMQCTRNAMQMYIYMYYSSTTNMHTHTHVHPPKLTPPSPVPRHHNPISEEYMIVKPATKLDSNHLVVVYKQKEETIERRIVRGLCVFIPGPEE